MKPPVSLDKQYKTRDGRETIIHTTNGPDKGLPVIVSVLSFGQWSVHAYPEDGQCKNECMHLIEVLPLWEGEVYIHTNGSVRNTSYFSEREKSIPGRLAGWRKIKVKQEEPT